MIRGIGPDYAMRMARQFGKEVFDIIEANPERLREVEGTGPIMSWNPHRLARDIRGIGFRTADVIAENLESISKLSAKGNATICCLTRVHGTVEGQRASPQCEVSVRTCSSPSSTTRPAFPSQPACVIVPSGSCSRQLSPPRRWRCRR